MVRLEIRLSQNPSSLNLGTTVWDASIVMAKFFEKVGMHLAVILCLGTLRFNHYW
jgi:hypothetical protein